MNDEDVKTEIEFDEEDLIYLSAKEKLVLEIIHLAYLIQTNTQYGVFIRFYGHVENLEIEITESKKRYNEKIVETNFYTKEERTRFYENYNSPDPLFWLKKKRDFLIDVLMSQQVDYEKCEGYEYSYVDYSF